jgi:hypothetical protein
MVGTVGSREDKSNPELQSTRRSSSGEDSTRCSEGRIHFLQMNGAVEILRHKTAPQDGNVDVVWFRAKVNSKPAP